MRLHKLLLALPIALSASALVNSAEPLDVRELMSAEEFRATGLDKLNRAELEALNRWLVRYTAREAPAALASNQAVKAEIRKLEAEVIQSRIKGEFTGWSGKTIFHLENGQTWKQRAPGSYYRRMTSPEVVITSNAMGYSWMEVLDTGAKVPVSRIE